MAKEFGATSTVWIGKDDTPIQVAKKAKESLLIKGFDKTIECSGVQSNVQAGLEVSTLIDMNRGLKSEIKFC